MKNFLFFSIAVLLYFAPFLYGAAEISPYLQGKLLEALEDNEPIPVMIILKDQADIEALDRMLYEENASSERRATTVISALQEKANSTQTNLLDFLSSLPEEEVRSYQPFWIINAIEVEAIPAVIMKLSEHPDVALLDIRHEEKLMDPVNRGPAPESILNNSEPGLRIINAHKMWALGYTGAGTIVMNRDTGVDGSHPALSSRWRGTHVPYNQAWYGVGTFPADNDGHGTHTMGTITALEVANNDTVGVAFGAEWIAADFNISFVSAFQWAMNPDGNASTTDDMPCVISNSWYISSIPPGGCLASSYATLFNNVEAAGIAIVWSAGNEGPNPQTHTSPKNINTNLVNTWATGALVGSSSLLPIASFSSRGPSGCGGTGSLLIKPEATAPGVSVRSTLPGGTYGLLDGTSMACPHVAGAVALLKEAFPNKTGHELKLALYYTAKETPADLAVNDPGEPAGSSTGEDHTYGKGVIDVYGAYEYLMFGPAPQPPVNLSAYSDFTIPTSMELTWTDPTEVITGDPLNSVDFHVYIGRDGVLIDSVAGGTESYTDIGLTDGQEYVYSVYARMDTSGVRSILAHTSWIAGGSPVPEVPAEFEIYGDLNEIKFKWMNPSRNIDNTPMDDFSGINLYRDSVLVTTFTRTSADTGRSDSAFYTPAVPGYYYWQISTLDNESPANESEYSGEHRTPLAVTFADNFSRLGEPDATYWIQEKVTIDERAVNPPSPPRTLNLNGTGIPVGNDVLESFPFDISEQPGNGLKFAYLYQPEGSGDPPLNTDSLILRFKNDAGDWVLITSYGGASLTDFQQEIFDMDSLSAGGNNYFHHTFQIQFSTTGRIHPIVSRADWFVDNVYFGPVAPAIGSSTDTLMFDSTAVGTQEDRSLNIHNIGLADLAVSQVISSSGLFTVDTTSFTLGRSTHLDIQVTYTPVQAGTDHARLDIISDDPNQDTLAIYLVGIAIPSTNILSTAGLPQDYMLSQNYPNPFNPNTNIHYELPRGSEVKLAVYNLLGQKVKTLVNSWRSAGRYDVEWKGDNDSGLAVSSGIYIYRIEAENFQKTMKMILMK
ncbi:MAG: S8 family serine peptidase [bacterium]|nr:MAG: S8 family serine peptidase [bacterium]